MVKLSSDYNENIGIIDKALNVEGNFDIIKKVVRFPAGEVTLYYIDGFVKDAVMQKIMTNFATIVEMPHNAYEFMERYVPYVETDVAGDLAHLVSIALSGATLMLCPVFGENAVVIDTREYPARFTSEPESDKVMRGARDGFVETIIFNTSLIRRRIRDPRLTMSYFSIGEETKTDVLVCYLSHKANEKYVEELKAKLSSIKTKSLSMGQQSLAECLIKKKWYNPFPKIRTTERPDTAAAQLLEGNVLILTDNSPQVMILPSAFFDFMQETSDFYFPPLTGTYIKLLRYVVFFSAVFVLPVWYLFVRHKELTPTFLEFVLPNNKAAIPIIIQIILVEFLIDSLKLASSNTPNMLANSLSVVSGLILGDFAVSIGWFIPEVILYMAFVAIANFTQRSFELGYAFKFVRIFLLLMIHFAGVWGFAGGIVVVIIMIATNKTVGGKRNYLYPLIPFKPKELLSLVVRVKKKD